MHHVLAHSSPGASHVHGESNSVHRSWIVALLVAGIYCTTIRLCAGS